MSRCLWTGIGGGLMMSGSSQLQMAEWNEEILQETLEERKKKKL